MKLRMKPESWWVTKDDDEFTRRARIAAERMAQARLSPGIERYLQTDRANWYLSVRKEQGTE